MEKNTFGKTLEAFKKHFGESLEKYNIDFIMSASDDCTIGLVDLLHFFKKYNDKGFEKYINCNLPKFVKNKKQIVDLNGVWLDLERLSRIIKFIGTSFELKLYKDKESFFLIFKLNDSLGIMLPDCYKVEDSENQIIYDSESILQKQKFSSDMEL